MRRASRSSVAAWLYGSPFELTSVGAAEVLTLTGAGAAGSGRLWDAPAGAAPAGGALVRVPAKIEVNPRFIPRHMTCVRIEPEAATVAPQAISKRLPIATPHRAAATPAVAFRNEINTGMSAPPMRIANKAPMAIESATTATSTVDSSAISLARAATMPAATTSSARQSSMASWRGRDTGVCGRRRSSLPAAIRLPLNVPAPTISPSKAATSGGVMAALVASRVSSTKETSRAAAPPMPCWKATRAGI